MHRVGNLLLLIIIFICIINDHIVDGNTERLKQCYPKFDNHTLCLGPGILNSVNSFAGLLRKSTNDHSIHQSNVWIILLHSKCHGDLERLLCTIYAPICLKGHYFTRVLPCQELCNSVKDKCLPRMKIYGFEWPSIVDCAKFPSERDASCIQLTDRTENRWTNSKIKRQLEERPINQTILSDEEERKKQRNCQICNRKVPLESLCKNFCNYSLVIRAKIANIFQKSKGALSIRLHSKSNIIFSAHPTKISLSNLITELNCKCPMLQNAKSVSRGKWLLIGDIENGQFVVKFLTKWQRKRKKFRLLFRFLKSNPKGHCRNQRDVLKMVNNQIKNNKNTEDYNKNTNRKKRKMENYEKYENQFYLVGEKK